MLQLSRLTLESSVNTFQFCFAALLLYCYTMLCNNLVPGRGESTNAAVVVSHQQARTGRGPALGRAMETNETRITGRHELDDEMKGMGLEDISSYEQYMTVS